MQLPTGHYMCIWGLQRCCCSCPFKHMPTNAEELIPPTYAHGFRCRKVPLCQNGFGGAIPSMAFGLPKYRTKVCLAAFHSSRRKPLPPLWQHLTTASAVLIQRSPITANLCTFQHFYASSIAGSHFVVLMPAQAATRAPSQKGRIELCISTPSQQATAAAALLRLLAMLASPKLGESALGGRHTESLY